MGAFWKHLFTAAGSAAFGGVVGGFTAPGGFGGSPKVVLTTAVVAALTGVVNYLRTPPPVSQ